ncbi:hypothetical protein DFS34DRAFT_590142 [Phlyctochytrium arcticum]|nr:hypothetical protein DFS34DRAFT_590142 [Phlyctochytrium arcticum]
MPARLQLPTEIIAQIVEQFRAPNTDDNAHKVYRHSEETAATLLALCQVSRACKDVARPHLWSSVTDPHQRDTAKHLLIALKANPQLRRFVQTFHSHCRTPDPTLFQTIPNFCPDLKALHLGTCYEMTDDELHGLAEKLDKLEHLTLLGCADITEDGWIKAIPFLKKLRHLHLSGSDTFRDKAVCAVADSCLHLQSLQLMVVDLTADGVLYVMLNAAQLVRLILLGSDRLERQDIVDILWQRPARLQLSVYFHGGTPLS